jgi:hypothetical protein
MFASLHTTITKSLPRIRSLLLISLVIQLVIRKLQDALGNRAAFFGLIGYTPRYRQSLDIVEDAKVMRFSAPEQIRKRAREWGVAELDRR